MSNHVEVIAEIGKNFVTTQDEEPLDILLGRAKDLIDSAKECDADVAKFQVHNVDDEIHPEAHFVSPHFDHDRYAWVKRNTYPVEFWWQIKDYCRGAGIEFLATPMSRGAAELLDEIGVDRWKIGSGDILDFVMLDYIRDTGKPIVLSSGMSTLEELRKAYNYVHEKTKEITILHCVSCYPCALEDLNLNTIPFLKRQFPEAKIGFSDHSTEVLTGLYAVQLGARIIEKHFSFSRAHWGPDHKVSLEPHEFAKMILSLGGPAVEIPEESLGIATKFLQEMETQFRPSFRKGLYAACDIREGEMFEPDMIIALRPCLNAPASELYPEILGTTANRSFKRYESLA